MVKPSQISLTYLKFLNLAQAIRELPDFPALDAVEEKLLNTFSMAWNLGKHISVVEAMNILPDVSPATAYRRLKVLRKNGWISLQTDEHDNRIKYIVATKLTTSYFAKMDACLNKARGYA